MEKGSTSRITTLTMIAATAVALVVAVSFVFFDSSGVLVNGYDTLRLGSVLVASIVLAAVLGFYYRRDTARLRGEIADREREVADLRRAKEVLDANEAPFQGVVASLPVALFALDTEGVFTLLEGRGLDALGLEPDKVIGQSIFETYRDAPRIVEDVRLALAGKSLSSIVNVNELTFEMRYSPLRVDEKFAGVLGIATNITQRKKAEEALEESQRRLSTLLSNAPAYLYRRRNEPHWPNEFVSDYALELTGYTPKELTGGTVMFGELILEGDRSNVWEEVQAALPGREGFELQYSIRRKDGEVRHVEDRGQGVYGDDGGVTAVEGVVYDVTERVRAEEALKEAEERYRTLVEQIPAVTYIDPVGDPETSLYTSPQIEEMLGYTPEEWRENKIWPKRIHPEDKERILAADERFEAGGEPFSEEYRLLAKDGSVVWVREEAVLVKDKAEEPLYWQGVIVDMTERKYAEEELHKSRANLAEAQRIAHLGSMEWDLKTHELYWSDEMFRIYGLEPQSFIPTIERLLEIVHPEDRKMLNEALEDTISHDHPYDLEHRIVKPGGEVRVVHRRAELVREEGGEPIRMVGTVHDVTERKALEDQLQHQALHDPLTGLPNRTLFADRLRQALARAKRRGSQIAVLFMDLDNFKVINDSLGHKAGDRLLVAASRRVKALLRPEDTVARLGGDEFIFLLEDTGTQAAVKVAERILEQFRKSFVLSGRKLVITASIGIATGAVSGKYAADLLRNADVAMYRAKHSGRGRYAVFEQRMTTQAFERLEMEHGLRRALERGELRVYYQPQMLLNAQDSPRSVGKWAAVSAGVSREPRIMGVEALVRWEHPERGLLLPDEFVPLAEETGLIVPIGEMVLEEACRQAREWQGRFVGDPPLSICVNLSARQFREPGLTQTVSRVLKETGLDPTWLRLEFTESTAMSDAPATISALEELTALGVKLAIDDFGTGYSSLSYLARLPVEYIKIDRSFVDGLEGEPGATTLVSGMTDLAHALGLKVIAEGVERAGQLERVRATGCDLAQGRYFSDPLPAKEAGALLEGKSLT